MAAKITKEKNDILVWIIIGMAIGGTIGVIVGWLTESSLASIPFGLIIGAALGYFMHYFTIKNEKPSNFIVQLKEEKLSISKERVKTGDVSIQKEVKREMKQINVPIEREELVITKNSFNHNPNGKDEHKEVTRIPISEEQIDIRKHKEVLNDVSVYTRQIQNHHPINETLKKEKIHIEANGNPVVINREEK